MMTFARTWRVYVSWRQTYPGRYGGPRPRDWRVRHQGRPCRLRGTGPDGTLLPAARRDASWRDRAGHRLRLRVLQQGAPGSPARRRQGARETTSRALRPDVGALHEPRPGAGRRVVGLSAGSRGRWRSLLRSAALRGLPRPRLLGLQGGCQERDPRLPAAAEAEGIRARMGGGHAARAACGRRPSRTADLAPRRLPSPPHYAVSTARGPVVADLRAGRRCPDGWENVRTGVSHAWGPAARLRRGGRLRADIAATGRGAHRGRSAVEKCGPGHAKHRLDRRRRPTSLTVGRV